MHRANFARKRMEGRRQKWLGRMGTDSRKEEDSGRLNIRVQVHVVGRYLNELQRPNWFVRDIRALSVSEQ